MADKLTYTEETGRLAATAADFFGEKL